MLKEENYRFYQEVNQVAEDKGLSISNAIKYFIKAGVYDSKFQTLRTRYYSVKRNLDKYQKAYEKPKGLDYDIDKSLTSITKVETPEVKPMTLMEKIADRLLRFLGF